jgi:hypothetical protein
MPAKVYDCSYCDFLLVSHIVLLFADMYDYDIDFSTLTRNTDIRTKTDVHFRHGFFSDLSDH